MCQNRDFFSKNNLINGSLLPIVNKLGLFGHGYVEPTVKGGSRPKKNHLLVSTLFRMVQNMSKL